MAAAKASTSELSGHAAIIDLEADFFRLFGLPRRFELDVAALEALWHRLQGQVHPDRFASHDQARQRQAMQQAVQVNEAFHTLRQPRRRAQYLLELAGIDLAAESNTAMPAAFLVDQLQWRENVGEARAQADGAALEALRQQLRGEMKALESELRRLFDDEADFPGAADAVRRFMFYEKLQDEIDDALIALED